MKQYTVVDMQGEILWISEQHPSVKESAVGQSAFTYLSEKEGDKIRTAIGASLIDGKYGPFNVTCQLPIGNVVMEIIYFRVGEIFVVEWEQVSPYTNGILSHREREVLIGICDGITSAEISQRLRVSRATVNTFRARITQKTGCTTVAAMVRWAIRSKLISP